MVFIMKNVFVKIREAIQKNRGMSKWKQRDYSGNTPQFIKEIIFVKYAIDGANWVETGTYKGTTTNFLSIRFPHVYTIEPEQNLYNAACKRLDGRNVTLFNDVSEKIFPILLPKLNGDINFWLDGHYSAGKTFKGQKDCPIEDELNAIEENLENFAKISILIDDVRLFLPKSSNYSDYPSIDYLVDWARRLNMRWRLEHDIFIIQKD